MDEILSDFIDFMEQEIEAFRQLLDLLSKQQRLIVQRQIDDFGESVTEEEHLILRMRDLEKERVAKAGTLSDTLGIAPGELCLTEIIQTVEDRYAVRLSELRKGLLALTEKVRNTNTVNRFLIEQGLRFVERNIQLLTGGEDLGSRYVRTGRAAPNGGRPVVDRMI